MANVRGRPVAMIGIAAFAGFAALVTLLSVAAITLLRRGKQSEVLTVQRWAERNAMELQQVRERALFEPSPFCLWTSHRTPNYFVRVRDQQGRERCGWVRLGTISGSIFGESKDKVEVRWEDT